ncbi:MAG: pseudouridine synthase [Alkalispirochaetaceae bacterium]
MPTPRNGALFTAGRDDHGRRLERILRKLFPGVPRSAINKALRKGDVRVGGGRAKADHRIEEGDLIEIRASFAAEARRPAERVSVSPTVDGGGSLEILFRSEDLLAVNKPPGLAVHGSDSLTGRVRGLLATEARDPGAGGGNARPRTRSVGGSLSFRPGPLHRLDKGTTGVIVFGLSLEGSKRFSAALKERRLTKLYLALLRGRLPRPERWQDTLEAEGKERFADLSVAPIIYFEKATLAVCAPHTGRTHQIRRQAALHGFPLLSDYAYQGRPTTGAGTPPGIPRLSGGFILHALSLSAPAELALGFSAILAPLPEKSANRLGSFVAANSAVEFALREGPLSERLARSVERLREEPGSASYLLSTIAAEIHDLRGALDELHGWA